jgi:hypothetical protein
LSKDRLSAIKDDRSFLVLLGREVSDASPFDSRGHHESSRSGDFLALVKGIAQFVCSWGKASPTTTMISQLSVDLSLPIFQHLLNVAPKLFQNKKYRFGLDTQILLDDEVSVNQLVLQFFVH